MPIASGEDWNCTTCFSGMTCTIFSLGCYPTTSGHRRGDGCAGDDRSASDVNNGLGNACSKSNNCREIVCKKKQPSESAEGC